MTQNCEHKRVFFNKRSETAKTAGAESFATSPSEYEEKIRAANAPISCIVSLEESDPRGDFLMLSIAEEKKTAVFQYEDGSYGYRTLTHILSADNNYSFGLVCSGSGEVEAYKILGEELNALVTEQIAKQSFGPRIVDPMFAFVSGQSLYTIFNLPTKEAAAAGAKLRKPVPSKDDSLVVTSGVPVAFKFDIVSGKAARVVPKMMPTNTYVTGLIDDPARNIPALIMVNVLLEDEIEEDNSPSFKSFFKRFFDEPDDRPVVRKAMPIGVSVVRLEENSEVVVIPQRGSREFGIHYVAINPLPDGDTNSIRLIENGDADEVYHEALSSEGLSA